MTQPLIQVISKQQKVLRTESKGVSFSWLEITPSCPLKCKHCYVASAPGLGHGRMKFTDWTRVLSQLKDLGCASLQFIGGEPTIHPHFCELVEYAARLGFVIEIYTNLTGITERMWSLFTLHRIHLATSFYSDSSAIHDEITATPGSFGKSLANIQRALQLGLTLRVGMVDMQDGQRLAEGKLLLETFGVKRIKVDRIRGVGRGNAMKTENPVEALCGQCAASKCAITANGEVFPCVFSRAFLVGNVLTSSMHEIVYGACLTSVRSQLSRSFATRAITGRDCDPDDEPPCDPDTCDPDACSPQWCNPDDECSPNNPEPCGPSCAPCIPDLN